MDTFPDDVTRGGEWSVESAERLIGSLNGVLSARIATDRTGEIDEVHVLTSRDTPPKQTVRNVESALRAQFDLRLDHRKISVAQTSRGLENGEAESPLDALQGAAPTGPEGVWEKHRPSQVEDPVPNGEASSTVESVPPASPHPPMPLFVDRQATGAEGRILFRGYQAQGSGEHPHRLTVTVAVEWAGERFTGEAAAALLPRARLEALAAATLRSLEAAMEASEEDGAEERAALVLDGVKHVAAFDREYVLVSVHGMAGPEVTPLAGTSPVRESDDHAVIRATLQATDRWVRGRL